MASALQTMNHMNVHHGYGAGAFLVGTGSGFVASVALGTLYGWKRDKWWGRWMPAFFAAGGKVLALATFLATGGRVRLPVIALNDVGQAGVNALGLHLGVKAGLRLSKTTLEVRSLGDGTSIAGELPPAAPGRGLEELTVEDLANLS